MLTWLFALFSLAVPSHGDDRGCCVTLLDSTHTFAAVRNGAGFVSYVHGLTNADYPLQVTLGQTIDLRVSVATQGHGVDHFDYRLMALEANETACSGTVYGWEYDGSIPPDHRCEGWPIACMIPWSIQARPAVPGGSIGDYELHLWVYPCVWDWPVESSVYYSVVPVRIGQIPSGADIPR